MRELLNTLLRAAIWSEREKISAQDVRDALLPVAETRELGILNRPLGEGMNLPDLMATVARHYLARALDDSQGNKSKAAELIGLPSYQTLTNWLNRYGVTRDGAIFERAENPNSETIDRKTGLGAS